MTKLLVELPFLEIGTSSRFYKNCKSVRKRGGKICQSCPFRIYIEDAERAAERAALAAFDKTK